MVRNKTEERVLCVCRQVTREMLLIWEFKTTREEIKNILIYRLPCLCLSFNNTQYKIMSLFFFCNSGCVISINLVITLIVFYNVLIFLFTWKPVTEVLTELIAKAASCWLCENIICSTHSHSAYIRIVGFIYYWYIQSCLFLLFYINGTISAKHNHKTLFFFYYN